MTQITLSNRETPSFAALTAGKALLGGVGGVAMISAENKIIEENDVSDPANFITEEVARLIAEKYQISKVTRSESIVEGLKLKPVIEAYPNSGLLIDVQTINRSFGYFPTKWGKYRVIYTAKLRLINSEEGQLLAEGFCSRIPDYDDSAPTKDELLANSAARLKAELMKGRIAVLNNSRQMFYSCKYNKFRLSHDDNKGEQISFNCPCSS